MNIWLLTIGEPIPQEGENIRLLRTGQYAQWLAARGHTVTFVNSTFDHYQKIQRYEQTTTSTLAPNYQIVCLYGRAYQKNVSISRFLFHSDVGKSFRSWVEKEKPAAPDVILSSYPIEELCRAALDYAEPQKIPVVIDCRDFWPDIFSEALPLPGLGKILFFPLERRAKATLARATALAGMTRSAMNWAHEKSQTSATDTDILFPFTYDTKSKKPRKKSKRARHSSDKLRIVFFGTLSHRVGLELIVKAAGKLPDKYKNRIIFQIAGTGSDSESLRLLAKENNAPIEFLGWINADQINALMNSADFGLLPYTRKDFTLTLPNKFSEYLSASLPVLSCTDGEVKKFILENNCGVWFDPKEEAITAGLINLIDNPANVEMRTKAKQAFDSTFEADVVFNRVTKELEALSSKPASLD